MYRSSKISDPMDNEERTEVKRGIEKSEHWAIFTKFDAKLCSANSLSLLICFKDF